MTRSELSLPVRAPLERRRVVLGAAALLLLVEIFVVLESSTQVSDSVTFLYAIPVMLIALELGARAGIATALAAAGLIGVFMLTQRTGLGVVDLIIRSAALIGVAGISGRFSTRMRDARRRQRQLLSSGLALAGRSEQVALPLLVARRGLELVPARGIRVTVEHHQPAELGRLDGETLELALAAGESSIGAITIARPRARPFTADERLALEMLAGQAVVAAESERLRALEREQAVLNSELSAAHGQLAEQGRRFELLFDAQEAERTVLAHELHDQSAQALTAIQLGLRAVERDLSSEPSRAYAKYLRECLAETLGTLRELAVGLRPPTLDQLGLEAALRDLVARAGDRSGHPISLMLERAELLPASLATTVYRLVDDIIAAMEQATSVRVAINDDGDELLIEAARSGAGSEPPISPELLARVRSRLDLTAGVLTLPRGEPRSLTASIPLSSASSSNSAPPDAGTSYDGSAGSPLPDSDPSSPSR
jgi:signal transduction histidine kinase